MCHYTYSGVGAPLNSGADQNLFLPRVNPLEIFLGVLCQTHFFRVFVYLLPDKIPFRNRRHQTTLHYYWPNFPTKQHVL